ncbi:MAG: hypothetical protein KDA61_11130 [Planctomycetales bacterium]|nr:hypothetical protein [Planctomycetales bacterium]
MTTDQVALAGVCRRTATHIGRFFATIACLTVVAKAMALPPLGLLDLGEMTGLRWPVSDMTLLDQSAYVGQNDELIEIDASGEVRRFQFPIRSGHEVRRITPPVRANDGKAYFVVSYTNQSELYALHTPTSPLTTGPEGFDATGVDRHARVYGTIFSTYYPPASAWFWDPLSGADIQPMQGPEDFAVGEVTPTGYASGVGTIPGTAGVGGGYWDPTGAFHWPFDEPEGLGTAFVYSIADRPNGGANIGYYDFGGITIAYGGGRSVRLFDGPSEFFPDLRYFRVSESEFAVVGGNAIGDFAFYPGIVPTDEGLVAPLADAFPELAGLDIDVIGALHAVDGRVYMSLVTTDDHVWFFGALDPSLRTTPEPSGKLVASVFALIVAARRRRYGTNSNDSQDALGSSPHAS